MRSLFKFVLPVVLLALAAGGFVYLKKTRPVMTPKPAVERSWTVATLPAVPGEVVPTIAVFGEIVAGREADLRPLVAGRVVEMGPDLLEGGTVRRGDLLIAIDPFDFEAEVADRRARLDEARARIDELDADREGERRQLDQDQRQLELARAEAIRRERLLGTGAGTQKALDDSRLLLGEREQKVTARRQTLKKLEARLGQTRAGIVQAEVALRRAERDLADTRLVAPADGFLKDVDVAVGKQVTTNDRVARLIAAGRLEARFLLGDVQFARLLEGGGFAGRPARVTWKVGGRDFAFEAVIERAEGRIDATAGGIQLFATLTGVGADTVLRPGAFVEVEIPDRAYAGVVAVPEAALHDAGGSGRLVYVARDSRLAVRPVEVAARDGDRVLVRGPFEAEDAIVVTRFPQMGPGVRVDVARPATDR